MNTKSLAILSALVLGVGFAAHATTYTDAVNDGALVGTGGGILDITSVEVSDTGTDLIFKINLNGDPVTTDWGKYMIGISSTGGGSTTSDGWSRPITMNPGMNYWVGSWVDSGNGAQIWNYTGTWNQQSAIGGINPDNLSISKNASSVTLQFAFAGLGLSAGNSFTFDVYTSGGGGSDGAVDALSNPNQTIANWGDAYQSASPYLSSYTITPVPEPTTLALLGLGSLALAVRVMSRKA